METRYEVRKLSSKEMDYLNKKGVQGVLRQMILVKQNRRRWGEIHGR